MKSHRYLHTLLYSCLLLLATCDFTRQTNVESGNQHKILYIANGDDPAMLDPHLATGLSEHNILQALFEGLVGVDPNGTSALPGVASRWELNEDRTRYTFHLDEQARWSNGDPVLAEDFVYAWRRMLDPQTAASYAYMLHLIKNAEAFNKGELQDFSEVGVSILDAHTLSVTLEQATPWFLQMLSHPAFFPVHRATLDKFRVGNPQLSLWTRPENIVSNGPFKLESWQINSSVKVMQNPYYRDKAKLKLKGMVFQHISDKSVEERAFRTGQVHVTNTPRIAIEKLAVYREENPELLFSSPLYASIYFTINTAHKPFDNPKVRHALALAIDRETLVKQVLKGDEKPAYSFIANNPNGFSPKQYFSFDPQKARELLREAGYPKGENFPTFELQIVNGETNLNTAIAIQEMWRKHLGIKMEIHGQEWKSWLQMRAAKDFALCTGSWYADYVDASNFFEVLRSDSGNNHTNWKNPEYDRLLDLAAQAINVNERYALLEQANRILAKDMPVIPLYQPMNNNLVHTSVNGWQPNPAGILRYENIELRP